MTFFDTSWNIEKYKNVHETKEHWELRKSFLLAHKEKFPENELACLAQVFVNVEMLGCRYPEETMKLVQELSESVADEYREKKKKKLQRTFVKASDAASSKAKGLRNPAISLNSNQQPGSSEKTSQKREIDNQSIFHPPDKKVKIDVYGTAPYGNVILFIYPHDSAGAVISRISSYSATNLSLERIESNNTEIKFALSIYGKHLGEGSGATIKQAKTATYEAALKELQKYYYTVKVNKSLEPNVSLADAKSKESSSEESLGDDNIGQKLMKLMGWGGGGLGKKEQGIQQPVSVQPQMNRRGLGLTAGKYDMAELKRKCGDLIRNFKNGDLLDDDLIFSADFSNEERAAIHALARRMNVTSKSYGPKEERTLILTRKIDPAELVVELKELGGSAGKYELIEPTG